VPGAKKRFCEDTGVDFFGEVFLGFLRGVIDRGVHCRIVSFYEAFVTVFPNCFYILKMPHMHVLWRLQVRLKIACKTGDSGRTEHFNIWHTQRVGYGHFFKQNFQCIILIPIREN
jgi:hypothetical protein